MAVFYVACRKSIHTDYEIEVPDLPGCTTVVKLSDDVDKKAREAINKHLIELQESGMDFIFVSAFKELVDLPGYELVTWYCLLNINTYGLLVKSKMH